MNMFSIGSDLDLTRSNAHTYLAFPDSSFAVGRHYFKRNRTLGILLKNITPFCAQCVRLDRRGQQGREVAIAKPVPIGKVTYQYLENTVRRLSLDADAVDLADLVSNVDEAGSIGRTAMHYARYHDLPGDLARFYGRPLWSTCKLMFSLGLRGARVKERLRIS